MPDTGIPLWPGIAESSPEIAARPLVGHGPFSPRVTCGYPGLPTLVAVISGGKTGATRGPRTPDQVFAGSLLADRALPSRRLLSSEELGWRTMLARTYRDPGRAEQFSTAQSRDLLIVLVVSGNYVIESRKKGRWHRANYHAGSIGVTAPGNVSVLRWRATSTQPIESLHLYLSAELLETTAAEFGGDGAWPRRLPDELSLDDPLVTAAAQAAGRALCAGAPPLYADSIAQMLVTHMLYGSAASGAPVRSEPGTLGNTAIRRVTDYMHEHLHEDVRLDDLAAQANVSKYHLLRSFAKSMGLTPHRYLVHLRMGRAAELLRTTSYPVTQIAMACGYTSPGQFAAAFRRRYGVSPTQFRRPVA
jgi:AraC family transcriptional regulator